MVALDPIDRCNQFIEFIQPGLTQTGIHQLGHRRCDELPTHPANHEGNDNRRDRIQPDQSDHGPDHPPGDHDNRRQRIGSVMPGGWPE